MNKILAIFFLLLLHNKFSLAQEAALLKEATYLELQMKEKPAFEKLKEVLKSNPENIFALNKCSELCSRIGKREPLFETRYNYYLAAKLYAEAALNIEPNNAAANCVMAIALGSIAIEKSGKEKVNAARNIKKYVDIALKNDPLNYKAWHVLGRWHFELSNLNIIESTAVKIFFGGLPAASIKESINAYEKANNLSKNFILNYFELAKAYEKNAENQKAIQTLKLLLQLPNKTEDDAATKTAGRKLLKDWQ